jgi:uncharacterized membrane protein
MTNAHGSSARTERSVQVPDRIVNALERLETSTELDSLAQRITAMARRVESGGRGDALRGTWLGHALHPILTSVPMGCWLAAGILDVTSPRRDQPAARRLIGMGLLASLPSAATGLAEYAGVRDERPRRVGAAHAVGNAAVALLYLRSWQARGRGHHLAGVAFAMAGATGASVTGYLGGHLAFARKVGTGQRGMDLDGTGDTSAGSDDREDRAEDPPIDLRPGDPGVVGEQPNRFSAEGIGPLDEAPYGHNPTESNDPADDSAPPRLL